LTHKKRASRSFLARCLVGGLLVAALAAGCGASGHGSRNTPSSQRAAFFAQRNRALAKAGCTTAVASAGALAGARPAMVPVAGDPFGVSSTRDGRWSFVDETLGAIAVFADARFVPRLVRSITVPGEAVGNSLTADGRYLLVAGQGPDGQQATVLSVARIEAGSAHPVLGELSVRGNSGLGGPIEVTSSPNGRYAFVSVEYADKVAVYDLGAAIADRFARSSYIGSIPLGQAVVGMAVSPNGRLLYVTSEVAAGAQGLVAKGTLSVISVARAARDPANSVVVTVPAQCQPVRVIVSSDGRTVWVTARASDDLLAFSAAKLTSDPAHALLAAVRVGEAPVGLAFAHHGNWVVVADSNRFQAPGAHASLTVVDSGAALAHRPAIVATIQAGSFPREMSLEGNGSTLLITNFGSGQLEAVDTTADQGG
jgi:DNA-binding beta-propeller fold protein YncE